MARRDINDETLELSPPAGLQLRRQYLNVPVRHKPGMRIEPSETFLGKGVEVLPQQLAILIEAKVN
jgi:hypothetical protein